jgi:hypothetical protein
MTGGQPGAAEHSAERSWRALLSITAVRVAKLGFLENGVKNGDQKCIAKSRMLFVGHSSAKYFCALSIYQLKYTGQENCTQKQVVSGRLTPVGLKK